MGPRRLSHPFSVGRLLSPDMSEQDIGPVLQVFGVHLSHPSHRSCSRGSVGCITPKRSMCLCLRLLRLRLRHCTSTHQTRATDNGYAGTPHAKVACADGAYLAAADSLTALRQVCDTLGLRRRRLAKQVFADQLPAVHENSAARCVCRRAGRLPSAPREKQRHMPVARPSSHLPGRPGKARKAPDMINHKRRVALRAGARCASLRQRPMSHDIRRPDKATQRRRGSVDDPQRDGR